jgi:tripartite-type tricarboxylate transporter receptor subunit TctC
MRKQMGLLISLFLLVAWSPKAYSQAPYYQGKTIKIAVGFTPGGFYDRWARLLSRYMPKYIPGNPEMIVQNMPGAGSVIATNYVYNVAKPDGLTMGMPASGIYLDQIVGRKEAQFDLRKMRWVGTPVQEPMILYMRADAPYKSVADIRNAQKPPRCGATGKVSSAFMIARLLEETMPPLKIDTVLGYPGGSEIDLAVERGEVACRAMTASPFFGREPFTSWQKKNFVRILLFTGNKRDERIPDTPTIQEIFDKEKVAEPSRRVAQVILAAETVGRPLMAPPATPAEHLKALRSAFQQALKDPELVAEAKKGRMDIDPVPGEQLEKLIKEVLEQPPEVLSRVKSMLEG